MNNNRNNRMKNYKKEIEKLLEQSTDWKCTVCKNRTARIVHSFILNRKIEKISDCTIVCKSCKEEIDFAIENQYISQKVSELEEIKEKTLSLRNDSYQFWKIKFLEKRSLTEEELGCIEGLTKARKRKLSSALKKDFQRKDLYKMKFNEKEIQKIKKMLTTFQYRTIV